MYSLHATFIVSIGKVRHDIIASLALNDMLDPKHDKGVNGIFCINFAFSKIFLVL